MIPVCSQWEREGGKDEISSSEFNAEILDTGMGQRRYLGRGDCDISQIIL